jgi:hypothetical protein
MTWSLHGLGICNDWDYVTYLDFTMTRIMYPNEFTMNYNCYSLEFTMTRKWNLTVSSEIHCDNLSFSA